jgi:hypothetical protein
MTNSSSRILDTYVSGLRAEVVRLSLMREHSEDTQWQSQLDLQIDLKLQLIDDVAQCLEPSADEEPFIEMKCNSQLILPTGRLSIS